MRTFLFILLTTSFLMETNLTLSQDSGKKSFYDFKMKTIDGKEFNFSQLKGKKVLIVNTASLCGYTPQYAELEELNRKYGGERFVILGFPANNFGYQEPGTNSDIASFCSKNYEVSFQMFSKISVKGEDMDPLYQWLTQQKFNGVKDESVHWNFQKFLIDQNGNWVKSIKSSISPMDEEIVSWIKK